METLVIMAFVIFTRSVFQKQNGKSLCLPVIKALKSFVLHVVTNCHETLHTDARDCFIGAQKISGQLIDTFL